MLRHFFLLLFCGIQLFAYTYRNKQQNIVVISPNNSDVVRQNFYYLAKSSKIINYFLFNRDSSTRIFFEFKDIEKGHFVHSRRYAISEKEFANKNIFEKLHTLNKLSLQRVFYDANKKDIQVPNWLILAYTSKLFRHLADDSDLFIVSPFIAQKIYQGKKVDIQKILNTKIVGEDMILYDKVSNYAEILLKFLNNLGGKKTFHEALLKFSNDDFINFYQKLSLQKKKKTLQESFNFYCINILSTMPYSVRYISFKKFYEKNFIIDGLSATDLLKKNEKENLSIWKQMLTNSFEDFRNYPLFFSKKILDTTNFLNEQNHQTSSGINNINGAFILLQREWREKLVYYNKRLNYFDEFLSQQDITKRLLFAEKLFKRQTNYDEYQKYFQNFIEQKK